jgi:hypothetical protein
MKSNLDGKLFNNEYNALYAQRPGSHIHYTASSGAPNTDNPKLAARYFLNAIDKVDGLVEKYTKEQQAQRDQIPQLQTLLGRPFEKDQELIAMKSELNVLEKEIARKIQEKQEAQQQPEATLVLPGSCEDTAAMEENGSPKEAIIVSLAGEGFYQPSLQTIETTKIRKGLRV